MKRSLTTSAAVLASVLMAAPAAQADGMDQIAASAGLSPAQAAGMSLTEIYAHKINRESGRDNKVTVSSRGVAAFSVTDNGQLVATAGLTPDEARGMSLVEVAAYKTNRDAATRDARIPVPSETTADFDPAEHPQLVASAGLAVGEAQGMSLAEIYRRKHNGESGRDEWQRASK